MKRMEHPMKAKNGKTKFIKTPKGLIQEKEQAHEVAQNLAKIKAILSEVGGALIRHYYIFTTMAMIFGLAVVPMTKATLVIFISVLVIHAIGEIFHWQDYDL
jgi:hypothetical protein